MVNFNKTTPTHTQTGICLFNGYYYIAIKILMTPERKNLINCIMNLKLRSIKFIYGQQIHRLLSG